MDKKEEQRIISKGEQTQSEVERVKIYCTVAEVTVHRVSRRAKPQPSKLTGCIL